MNVQQLQDMLDFAVDAARQAGELTLKHFHSDAGYEMKADNTPVTIADRGAEELLHRRIEQAYPTHGIVGEEFREKVGSEPARWIIDPIDGTFADWSGKLTHTAPEAIATNGHLFEPVMAVVRAVEPA